MSRGSRTLFVNNEIKEHSCKGGKGRSRQLHEKRNNALIHRFYYLSTFTKWRYDLIITQLSEEFYLSPVTIPEILTSNFERLSEVRKKKPSVQHLKAGFPHINWTIKVA